MIRATSRVVFVMTEDGDEARFRQMMGVYQAAGLTVDLILPQSRCGLPLPESIHRVGIAPNSGRLAPLLAEMHADHALTAVHFDRPRDEGELALCPPGATVIVDHDSSLPRDPGSAPPPSLTLTSSEAVRRRLGARGHPALRLPRRLGPTNWQRTPPGRRIGWFGHWTPGLMDAWQNLARAFIAQSICPDMTFMLIGPGAPPGWFPNGLAIARRPFEGASSLRAIDIAVLPVAADTSHIAEIHAALEHGCPVLTLQSADTEFEDRWRLPVAADLGGLVHLIDRSLGAPATLDALLRQTCAEFRRDQAAMERHLIAEIRHLIGT
ncbi:hypothetical protein KHP62_05650 [Rhodobacteraceae bacterium NNCM2]|nr:hypothetical protein [Coraliihabitans acroporae]